MTSNQPQHGQSVLAQQQTAPQFPGAGPVGQPVNQVNWFRQMPTGGTVFVRPSDADSE